MPGVTTCMSYPYPLSTDRIDVAGDIARLAQAVDTANCGQTTLLNAKVSKGGDTMTGMLTLPPIAPTSDNHAIRKVWADGAYVQRTGVMAMTGPLILDHFTPTHVDHAVRKGWADSEYLKLSGGTVTGVVLVPTPTAPNHVVNKSYVDTTFVELSGDTMTGTLNTTNIVNSASVRVGGDPNTQEGMLIGPNGRYESRRGTVGASIWLNRVSDAADNGQTFIEALISGTVRGRATILDATHVDWVNVSDHRLKVRHGDITDATERVRTLARKTYRGRWIDGSQECDLINADDIATVAPYAVLGEYDGEESQMVSFTALFPLVVRALGEALDRIEELEAA